MKHANKWTSDILNTIKCVGYISKTQAYQTCFVFSAVLVSSDATQSQQIEVVYGFHAHLLL